MADPVGWANDAIAKYGATAVGLVIGTLAKYGLTLTEGRRLTWRGVLADFLLLGMLGLLAILISDWMHLTGNARVMAGALAAVSSDRLVRLIREAFLRRAAAEMQLPTDARVEMPGGTARPRVIKVRPTPGHPMRAELREAFEARADHDPQMDSLIEQIDGDEV